jgi:hypothetical protein
MLAVSRRSFTALRSFAVVGILGAIAILAACSDDPKTGGPVTCDSAKCAAGNTCLPLNGETKCRKTCTSNADPATSCPFGYTCVDTQTGVAPFCVQDTALRDDGLPIEKKPSGQWGSKCQANLGVTNPGCDSDQGFFCYGTAPTDGDAYCTRYGCELDSDCGAGFWCGQINRAPNVAKAKRSYGEVDKVCLRRTFCSTCKVDLDCPPVLGRPQHCATDANGGGFCAPECDANEACNNEAKCVALEGLASKICYPRANVCVGDGSVCSPCRVDSDCGADGACVKGSYTTERTCAKKVGACAECPKDVTAGGKRVIGCSAEDGDNLPANHCVGLYVIGDQPSDLGCYTPDRK